MSISTGLQDRMVLITIFSPSDTKHREPLQIRGRIAYIGDLGDERATVEIEVDAESVTVPAPKTP